MMMKKLFVPVLLLLPALIATGQNATFKSRTKYSSGTIKPGFDFVTVNQNGISKSEATGKPVVSPSLERLLLKGSPQTVDKVIRKDGRPVYIERKTDQTKSDHSASPGEKLARFLEETRISAVQKNPKNNLLSPKLMRA
jgi:hypothetical protein